MSRDLFHARAAFAAKAWALVGLATLATLLVPFGINLGEDSINMLLNVALSLHLLALGVGAVTAVYALGWYSRRTQTNEVAESVVYVHDEDRSSV